MPIERVEQRVLGALQLVDSVTQTPVRRALKVASDSATLVRNRRGWYVITRARGLEDHSEAFLQPPAVPAIAANEYRFEISDPHKRYLPRMLRLRLPRDPDPAHVGNDNSLFTPRDVAMYPAGTASLSHNWSSIRVSVSRADDSPVAGALIRIIDIEDDSVLASGISDERGEALVIVPGVPVTQFAGEEERGGGHDDDALPVVVNTLPVRLELSVGAATPWPVDPDLLQQQHVANRRVTMDLTLSTGRMERAVIQLT